MVGSLKIRAMLVAGGLLLGLAGVGTLACAATAALIPWLGLAGAAGIVGTVLAGGAGAAIWFATRPAVPMEEELAGVTEAAQDALSKAREDAIDSLAELPLNAVNRLIEEQPIAALLGVAAAAYTVTRAPGASVGVMERMIARLV